MTLPWSGISNSLQSATAITCSKLIPAPIYTNLSRTVTGNASFIPTLVATAVLVLCSWLFSHLAAYWPPFAHLVKGDPVPLIRGSHPDRRSMGWAGVSEADIEEAARQSGLRGLDHVGEAFLERSGKISTIRSDESCARS